MRLNREVQQKRENRALAARANGNLARKCSKGALRALFVHHVSFTTRGRGLRATWRSQVGKNKGRSSVKNSGPYLMLEKQVRQLLRECHAQRGSVTPHRSTSPRCHRTCCR